MREITVKSIWKRDAAAVDRWMGIPNSVAAEGIGYVKSANDMVLTFAMIETRKAMENLDDIPSMPGLGAVYVGPADLGLSVGGEQHVHCGLPESSRKAIAWGYQFTTILSDDALLVNAVKAAVGTMHEGNVTGGQTTGKRAAGSMY